MNLLQTIRLIERSAALQPGVRTIVRNDIYRLNACPDVDYGVFAWLQSEHTSEDGSSIISYNFTFFYADRLTTDKANELEVQSQGIETLENILRSLPALGLYPAGYSFRAFNERFSDECAGVYCTVTLDAGKDTLCATAYESLNGSQGYNPSRSGEGWSWTTPNGKTVKII